MCVYVGGGRGCSRIFFEGRVQLYFLSPIDVPEEFRAKLMLVALCSNSAHLIQNSTFGGQQMEGIPFLGYNKAPSSSDGKFHLLLSLCVLLLLYM